MPLYRHIPFLKAVLLYAFTAFGGPQGHIGMMVKTFVRKRKDVTEEELMEYNAFCQMLPGPSSTQTVTLIAMKRGGIPLAIITLVLWILPAFLIMTAFSFLVYYLDLQKLHNNLFSYIKPMSVGFIGYAAVRMTAASVRVPATWLIMGGAIIATLLIRSPWVFPCVLLAAGAVSNFSSRRIPGAVAQPRPVRWLNLWLFAALFILAGIVSELARQGAWPHRRIFNLFENFYRFGSIVFGGGQALLPMMLYQFVSHPISKGGAPWLSSSQLLTGYGLVQAAPGPVFAVCTFTGGMIMSSQGPCWQLLGCAVSTIAVFLPSTLLLFFLFPIYHNLKQHVIIYRALEGINAAIAGIVWASGIVLWQSVAAPFQLSYLIVIAITFCLLQFTRIPAPLIVSGWLLLGLTLN